MYPPSHDSLLLLDSLKHKKTDKIIEIGVGSGFIIRRLKCELAVGTDIDEDSLMYARQNLDENTELVLCDCAEAFRNSSFDVAYFNPPYLPGKISEDPETIGGDDGSAIPIKMLESSSRVIRKHGLIFFVVSSQTQEKKITEKAGNIGDVKVIRKMRLFYETLRVYMIKKEVDSNL